jgi:hypothetical protein
MKVTQVKEGWDEVLDRYGIRHVLVPAGSALASTLARTPGWHIEYRDDTAIVLTRL